MRYWPPVGSTLATPPLPQTHGAFFALFPTSTSRCSRRLRPLPSQRPPTRSSMLRTILLSVPEIQFLTANDLAFNRTSASCTSVTAAVAGWRCLCRSTSRNEFLLRELLCLMHPDCTSELGSFSTRHLHELPCFRPPDFPKLWLRCSREMLVDCHEGIGPSPGVGEAFLQIFVKRIQILQAPVLLRAHLA